MFMGPHLPCNLMNTLIWIFYLISIASCQVSVLHHPRDTAASLGEEVKLDCEFNKEVKCEWTRESKVIARGDAYHFNDKISKNCTLIIKKVSQIDFAEWKCESIETDNLNAITSRKATVSLKQPHCSENVTGIIGESITLPCKFDFFTSCVWKRSGGVIDSKQEYKYADGNTKDCSLIIKSVTGEDITAWLCVAQGSSDDKSTGQREVCLTRSENSTIRSNSYKSSEKNDSINDLIIYLSCGLPVLIVVNIIIIFCLARRNCTKKKSLPTVIYENTKNRIMGNSYEMSSCSGESELTTCNVLPVERTYDSVCPEYGNLQQLSQTDCKPEFDVVYADLNFPDQKNFSLKMSYEKSVYAIIKES